MKFHVLKVERFPNSNRGICNLVILLLCYAVFAITTIFPGAHSNSLHGEIEVKESELSDEMPLTEFGQNCTVDNTCKDYEGTVECNTGEGNETNWKCDCIWNTEKHPGKYVLNDNRTRCVGLAYSPCSISQDKINITCVKNAECKNDACDCDIGFSPDENSKCLINYHESCIKDNDECLSFNGNVSCQTVENITRCDCSLNGEGEGDYNYTLHNGTCVGLVNSTCGTENRAVGCVHNAFCSNISNICTCHEDYTATLNRTCLRNAETPPPPLPYNASCVAGSNHAKCFSYDGFVDCVDRKVEDQTSSYRCDCKGNENIHHSLQGNYMWENNKCLGYLGSPCNPDPSKGPSCIENAECKEFNGRNLCLCSPGWAEHYDRLCNVTYNPVVKTTTPNLNHSNCPESLLLIPLLMFVAVTQSLFFRNVL